jgi:glc operon protein GlcG
MKKQTLNRGGKVKRNIFQGILLSLSFSFLFTVNGIAQLANKKAMTLELAKKISAAAETEAVKNKLTSVISILDDGGNLIYLERMDNAQLGSIEVATGKARTAVYFKRSTKIYEDQVSGGRNLLLGVPNIVPVEGGLPLLIDGQVIGAIGVSGGTPQQDGLVAKAGTEVLNSTGIGNSSISILPEHFAFNVQDAESIGKWYIKNLKMQLMREATKPNYNCFLADAGKHYMIELFDSKEFPYMDLNKLNTTAFHLAFMVKDISSIKEKLLSLKCSLIEDIKTTQSGDKVLMLRDPWGLPIQFVERQKPMLEFAEVRPEHFAINVADSRAKAKWYAENLDMKIVKEGTAPDYGMFVADLKDNMMIEIYQKSSAPLFEDEKTHVSTFHAAFITENITAVKDKLLAAGAKLITDITKTPAGDKVLMFRDPWGQPLQIVERLNNMLK